MNHFTLSATELAELSVHQLSQLPHRQLQEADVHFNELMAWTKQVRARLDAALEQRYGEQGRAALRDSGRDCGVAHFTDGPLRITVDVPKRVVWDQHQLSALAERIVAGGDRVEHYLDVEFSIPETRFKDWKPALQQQFAAARTVKPGKPAFRLALTEDSPVIGNHSARMMR